MNIDMISDSARDIWAGDLSHDPRILAALTNGYSVREALEEVRGDVTAPARLRRQAQHALAQTDRGIPLGDALDQASRPPSNPDGSGLVPFSPFVPSGPQGEPQQISRPLPGSSQLEEEPLP